MFHHMDIDVFKLKSQLGSWCIYYPFRNNEKNIFSTFRAHLENIYYESMQRSVFTLYFLFCLQNLQVKMRGRGFPWSKLLMVLLVFAAGFIAHDVRSHGSFAGLSQSCILIKITCLHVFCQCLKAGIVCLRLRHSQASSQLRCHSRISAGLEQNNSLHQTRFQVWASNL